MRGGRTLDLFVLLCIGVAGASQSYHYSNGTFNGTSSATPSSTHYPTSSYPSSSSLSSLPSSSHVDDHLGSYIAAGLGISTESTTASNSQLAYPSSASLNSISAPHYGNISSRLGSKSQVRYSSVSSENSIPYAVSNSSSYTSGTSSSYLSVRQHSASSGHLIPYGASHGSVYGTGIAGLSPSIRPPLTSSGHSMPYGASNGSVQGSGTSMSSPSYRLPNVSSGRSVPYAASKGSAYHTGTVYNPVRTGTGYRPYATGTDYLHGNKSLAPTGSGYAYANACNQASVSWSKKHVYISYFTPSTYYPTTQTTAPPVADVYTLCDGIPRMRTNVTTQQMPFASLQQLVGYMGNPTTTPVCSIQPTDCSSLLLSYSSAHKIPGSVSLGPIHTSYEPFIPDDFPRCQTNTIGCGTVGAQCALTGSGIQLYYWPQTWAGGYCGDQKEIVTMGPTIAGKPNTAVVEGYTFTSPTVYVKYATIRAQDYCDNPVGPTLTSGIIPMASESVSSKVPYFMTPIPWQGPSGLMHIGREVGITNAMFSGWPGINPIYGDARVPVTYPDLDPETVPAIPYYQREMMGGDPWCYYGGCPTMVPWNYFPRLDVPAQARQLAPEWASCSMAWGAMDDPPTSIVKMPSEVKPTMSNTVVHTTTQATPGRITAVPISQTAPAATKTKAKPSPRPAGPSPKPTTSPPPAGPSPNPSPSPADPSPADPSPAKPSPAKPSPGNPSPANPKPDPNPSPAENPAPANPSPATSPNAITALPNDPSPHTQKTPAISPVTLPGAPQPITVTGATLTPIVAPGHNPGRSTTNFVVGTQTIQPGATGVVVSGTSYSIDPSGSSVYVNGQGTKIPGTDAGGTHTKGVVVDGTKTIAPGGVATVGGTTYSVGRGGGTVVVDGTPVPVPSDASPGRNGDGGSGEPYSQAEVTGADGAKLTVVKEPGPNGTGAVYVVGSATVTAGGSEQTIAGEIVSANGRGLVVDAGITQAAITAGSATLTAVETTDAAGHTGLALIHTTILPDGRTKTITDAALPSGSSAVLANGETISQLPSGSGILFISSGVTTTLPFSTTTAKSRLHLSSLPTDETMLAISGTPVLFSERVVKTDGRRVTEYVHGQTTLTATVIGHGKGRRTEFVGNDGRASSSSVPVSISAFKSGRPVAAAMATTSTGGSAPTSTSGAGGMIVALRGKALVAAAMVLFWIPWGLLG